MGLDLSNREHVFILILIINLIISLLYLLINVLVIVPGKDAAHMKAEEALYDRRTAYILRTVVMLLCPVIGPLYFFIGYLFYLLLFRRGANLEDVIFSKERIDSRQMADEDRERDIIPLEEAVLVNERKDLRSIMMNVLRGDVSDSLSAVSLALRSEDSEVSHYAASVLSRELNQFRINVQNIREQLSEDSTSEAEKIEYAELLIGYMNSILKQHILSPAEQLEYVRLLGSTADMLYETDPSRMTLEQMEAVCLRLLEEKEYTESEKWADRLAEHFPDELPAYTCRLKLYFLRQDKDAFFNLLNRLKHSNVVIDHETLELIRVFG